MPSIDRMHREVEEHVKTLNRGGNRKARKKAAAAESLHASLTEAKTWGNDHGEDDLMEIKKGGKSRFAIVEQIPDQLLYDLANGSPQSRAHGKAFKRD